MVTIVVGFKDYSPAPICPLGAALFLGALLPAAGGAAITIVEVIGDFPAHVSALRDRNVFGTNTR